MIKNDRKLAIAKDVSNPLIVIMGIGKNDDEDDMNAKKQDYTNLMFAFNHLLGYSVGYNSINNDKKDNDDSKQQENKKDDDNNDKSIKFNYIQDKMKHQDIQSESYQLLWKTDDIDTFSKNVYEILVDKNNKHDGVFFYLLFYHNDGTKVECMLDSYGNKYFWLDEPFFRRLNPIWTGHMVKYPIIWFVEAYKSIDATFEEAKKKNIEIMKNIKGSGGICMTGDSVMWLPHTWTHVIPNANKNGGILTQATKKIFRHPSVAKGRCLLSILLNHMRDWIDSCNLAMIIGNIGGVDGVYLIKPK